MLWWCLSVEVSLFGNVRFLKDSLELFQVEHHRLSNRSLLSEKFSLTSRSQMGGFQRDSQDGFFDGLFVLNLRCYLAICFKFVRFNNDVAGGSSASSSSVRIKNPFIRLRSFQTALRRTSMSFRSEISDFKKFPMERLSVSRSPLMRRI